MKFGFSILIVHLGQFLVGRSIHLFLFCVGTGDSRMVHILVGVQSVHISFGTRVAYEVGVQSVHVSYGTRVTTVVRVIAGDTSTFAYRRRVINFDINLAIDLHRNGFIVIINAHVFDFFSFSGTFLVMTRGVPSHYSSLGVELMSKRVQLQTPLARLLVSLGNREIPRHGRILRSGVQFFAIGKFLICLAILGSSDTALAMGAIIFAMTDITTVTQLLQTPTTVILHLSYAQERA
jgi:hypothetical protein